MRGSRLFPESARCDPSAPGRAVRLDGFFENDIRNSIDHWNKGVVPYAAMVDFFRNGRSQFALGEMWGKAVRSGCMFYRYTADPELKEILSQTVKDLLSTVRPNGSISCVPPEKQPDGPGGDLWERKYVLLGLDRYYDLVEADPAVLRAMTDQADCIIEQVGEPPKVPITSLGWSPNHIESSTLLEPFMRLYNRTGEKRYLDFARYIVSTGGSEGYDIFRQAYDNVPPHEMGGPYPKAYEMMSMFEGAVEYYRVTGDEYVRRSFMNLYDNIRRNEITIVGNGGGDQPYHPAVMGEGWDHTAVEQTNPDITRMMETCVGVTWMKFCSQILRLTGDPSAVDEIEKYIYNGLLGAMKPSGDGFSYVNLFNGEKVTNYGWGTTFGSLPVTCCNLNGPMGLAYIPFVAVMESDRGPVVNLYNAARAELSTPQGDSLSLRIETDFPLSDRCSCGSIRMPRPFSRCRCAFRRGANGPSSKSTAKRSGASSRALTSPSNGSGSRATALSSRSTCAAGCWTLRAAATGPETRFRLWSGGRSCWPATRTSIRTTMNRCASWPARTVSFA